ncbi:ATP-binding protein [Candidatus Woesearchaeota archaeon]|nr:ATP-binding protein [Candidatus Woesearchaeota archaeon]
MERKYVSGKAELIILYGRRRIGKTELLRKFLEKKAGIYFLGRLESPRETIKRFNISLLEFFKDTELASKMLRNWDDILDYIAEKSKKTRLLVVFDEFPFIIEKYPAITSILQDKWDSKLRHTKVMLVLCGSSIGMMEKHTISYKSPLYGRRTGQWMVDKLRIKHLKEFLPNYSIEDLVIVYSCVDTIPGYVAKFEQSNVWHNIKEKILTKGEFLYEEIEILLREELRDPSNYMTILSAIASGATKFNEIHNLTHLDKSLLSKYLYILERLNIVEKEFPIISPTKKMLKRKGALYFLKDNFFDFWLNFVYPNKQELERGNIDEILKKIKQNINTYLGKKFERFVKELIIDTGIFSYTKIGRWWFKDKEIDIVALNDEKKQILFGECKWQANVNAEKIVKELAEKAQFVQWFNNEREESFAVFAKSFKKRVKSFEGKPVYCFDLKDLEKLFKARKRKV